MRIFACVLAASLPAFAAESDVANRNLGLSPEAVAKAKGTTVPKKPLGPVDPAVRIETIEVYADPEDFARRQKPAMRGFADRLDAIRPLTPAEKAQRFLSFFLGGPPPEKELSAEERAYDRVQRAGPGPASTQRGTLQ